MMFDEKLDFSTVFESVYGRTGGQLFEAYHLKGATMISTCAIKLPPSAINIDFSCFGPYLYSSQYQASRFSSAVSLITDELRTGIHAFKLTL